LRALSMSLPDLRPLLPQHAGLVQARDALGPAFATTQKLATVRNPWERLVSWRAFLAGVTEDFGNDPAALTDPVAAHWQEFDAFLEQLAASRITLDGRQVPEFSQFHQLSDAQGQLLVDHLFRFETISEDVARVLTQIGLKAPALPHTNGSHHLPYQSYYSRAGRELVADAFADDVRAFDYHFEGTAAST